MGTLDELADGIWVQQAPLRFMGLLEIGSRMTVLRAGDDLVVHSPIEITPDVKAAIEAIGPVRFIIAPSMFHHLNAGSAANAWPDAKVLAPRALRKKRPDLRIDHDLEDGAPAGWKGSVDLIKVDGCMLDETVLFHRKAKTLITADLFENFTQDMGHGLTRLYLTLGGVYKKPGWHRFLKFVYRDKKAARASLEAIQALDMERIVIAHGDIVTSRPHETMREALAFLLAG